MDKYFICLANSYKHQNRCIAGVEISFNHENFTYELITNSYGNPKWFRPVNENFEGAIPYEEAKDIKLFDVVEATDVVACPSGAQVENYSYSSLKRIACISPDLDNLRSFSDYNRKTIFGDRSDSIIPEKYEKMGYSIIMIEMDNVEFYFETRPGYKPKPRARFTYKGNGYDLKVTDPDFRDQMEKNLEQANSFDSYFLTLSLGVKFKKEWDNKEMHYKLVAGVTALNH